MKEYALVHLKTTTVENSKRDTGRQRRFKAIGSCFAVCLHLQAQWARMAVTYKDVADDAVRLKRKGIRPELIVRWINSFDEKTMLPKPDAINLLTDESILWLCKRWDVHVKIEVKRSTERKSQDKLIKGIGKFEPTDIYKR